MRRTDTDRLCPGCQRTYTVTGGEFDPDWTIHPGTAWAEIIDATSVTVGYVAAQLEISRPYLSNILHGRGLPTAELTVRFARWAGIEPRFMWQLVANYRLDLALGKKDV